MNRSNPFRFDLRNGIRFIAKKFLVLPLLVSLVCFEFMLRLRETASLNHQYAGAQPTLGDFAMYLFGGMKPYFPNPDEPFLFPVSWFLVFGICLFLTLYYPVYDRDTFGKMVIVYSGSRTKWWTAKCAWIIVATFLYFFLCWILLLINCLLYGGQFTLSVSPYMSDIFLLRETVPVECMPCTPAHASIDRIFFRHIANAANALVSPHYLFFDISNSYVGIGILLRPCIDPQLCILHSQQ